MTIAFPQSSSGSSTIKQWEAAGASLVAALANYADSCLSLGLNFAGNDVQVRNLALQIDSALETHSAINMQLRRSAAPLSRMRNRVLTPLHRIPGEILSYIFMDVIQDFRTNALAERTWYQNSLLRVCRRRHNLMSVCSTWRNVISARASFWSTILITDNEIRHQMLETYLQRAGGSMLRLVVTAETTIPTHVIRSLSRYIPQFRSLVVQSRNDSELRRVINMFLRKDIPHSLSELSLRWRGANLPTFENSGHIYPPDADSGFLPASALIESLHTLRLSNTNPLWEPARAAQLLKLQINRFCFRDEADMIACLRSVSSAPQLRDLELLSIRLSSYPDLPGFQENSRSRTISFPELQNLTISGFNLDDLRVILGSIRPGSHRLTLHLTETSFLTNSELEVDHPGLPTVEGLISVLGLAPVDSLVLNQESQDCLYEETELFNLLSSVPELKTLKIGGWGLISGHLWDALMRPTSHNTFEDTDDPEFPRLQNLHLNYLKIHDEERLKAVVKSHGIQRLELGVRKASGPPFRLRPEELQSLSTETIDWLRSAVPELSLVDPEYYPPEFNTSGWERPIYV